MRYESTPFFAAEATPVQAADDMAISFWLFRILASPGKQIQIFQYIHRSAKAEVIHQSLES
jgi:hypothetical protein